MPRLAPMRSTRCGFGQRKPYGNLRQFRATVLCFTSRSASACCQWLSQRIHIMNLQTSRARWVALIGLAMIGCAADTGDTAGDDESGDVSVAEEALRAPL